MMSNLQILEQFVMSLHRMSAEMLSIGVGSCGVSGGGGGQAVGDAEGPASSQIT